MITKQDILLLTLDKDEVIEIIAKAKQNFNIARLDNLRVRHPNIQFDCLLRGYVGEYAMRKYLCQNGIVPDASNFFGENENMDVDFLYKGRNIELKTSLVPSVDGNIENTIRRRDIKLIKRENLIENLRGDIHLQIYFDQRRTEKDNWLASQEVDLQSNDFEYLYDKLKLKAYQNTTYFVAWIDKETLVQRVNSSIPDKKTWTFPGSKRDFWSCKIRDAKTPASLTDYLRHF